jgi:hypothetical protein
LDLVLIWHPWGIPPEIENWLVVVLTSLEMVMIDNGL